MFSSHAWGAVLRSTIIAMALLLSFCQQGQTQVTLTTIQDTVYLADGSKFNGLALIEWKSFDTQNGSVIGRNSKVVRIVDGLLQVQLAPTTTQNNTYYTVKYSSGGRVLFTEIWAVSPSTVTLKLRDVRAVLLPGGFVSAPVISGGGGGNNGGGGGGGTVIIGNGEAGGFVDNETPTGLINGSNLVFTLASAPSPSTSLDVFRNGVRLAPTIDYTLSTNTITFVSGAQPQTGDVLRANYRTGQFGTAAHNLLSATHGDTTDATVVRGDLIVGQGTTTKWQRLPLGSANRCLVSNGLDAVWNSCLFTGFTTGSVPFVNSTGVLAQDNANFFFDSTNRRLGLGTASPAANLTIQAQSTQGTTDLTRWVPSTGTSYVARVTPDGTFEARRVVGKSDGTVAGFRDEGFVNGVDPSSLSAGDFWYNRSQRARKTYEACQVHTVPQIICSVGGGTTTSTSLTSIGTCGIPAELLDSGDRIEISLNFEHTGTASGFRVEIFVDSTSLFNRDFAATDTLAFVKGSGGFFPTGISLASYSFGTAGTVPGSAFSGLSANTTLVPTAAKTISFRARLLTGGGDSVFLRNFTVIRYPAQFNP
jgi:hypothetical protein